MLLYLAAILCCVCLPLSVAEVIPVGLLLMFVWVLQHSIKLVKYAQGYLSQPERLWSYMSPSNRCTDYGLQRAPEEWLKQSVRQAETRPSWNVLCAITFKKAAGWYIKNHLSSAFFLITSDSSLKFYVTIRTIITSSKSVKCEQS